jgi:hypothetical protein
MDQMVVDDVKPVMVTDAGVNSHPIVVPVSHPNQITEVFDAISYSKVKYMCINLPRETFNHLLVYLIYTRLLFPSYQ